jgi:hypothetical protein
MVKGVDGVMLEAQAMNCHRSLRILWRELMLMACNANKDAGLFVQTWLIWGKP